MHKMLKYELIGRYIYIAGGCAAIVLINIFLMLGTNMFGFISNKHGLSIVFSFLAGFAALVVATVGGISRLAKDLFSDTGYLTFTVPQRGYSLLGAKFIASLIEFALFAALSGIFGIVQIVTTARRLGYDILHEFTSRIAGLIFIAMSVFVGFAFFVMMAYFSLALAKSLLKNRKFGKLFSFMIFIAISIMIGYITDFLREVFPQTVNLDLSRLFNVEATAMFTANISEIVFDIVFFAALFIGTSYLIEKKVDI